MRPDELYHYGRQGMKWYHHIFGPVQKIGKYASKGASKLRKDLTPEERAEMRKNKKIAREERRAEKEEFKYEKQKNREIEKMHKQEIHDMKMARKQHKQEEHDAKEAEKNLHKEEVRQKSNEQLIREGDAKTIMANRHRFTDAELARAYDRLNTQNKIQSLLDGNNGNQGKQFANNNQNKPTKSLLDTAINAIDNIDKIDKSITTAANLVDKYSSKYSEKGKQKAKERRDIMNDPNIDNFFANWDKMSAKDRVDYANTMEIHDKLQQIKDGTWKRKKPKPGDD